MSSHRANLTPDILTAALEGLGAQKRKIQAHIAEVRSMLGIGADGMKRRGRSPKTAEAVASAPVARKRRRFSAETRAHMAEAQRKRWAAQRGQTEAAAPATKKRRLSSAGRKRIREAAKRRWAAQKAKAARA